MKMTASTQPVGGVTVVDCLGSPPSMKKLIEEIARALVDHPEGVQVDEVNGSEVAVLELRTHPQDLGKVIGRQGRTAKAIRTLLGAAGMKLRKRFTLEILESHS